MPRGGLAEEDEYEIGEIVIMAGSARPTGNFSEQSNRDDCSTENFSK
jgi:hypothetical protein